MILAKLERPTKRGLSIWSFIQEDEVFYAINNFDKRVSCSGKEDMRRFYKRMLSYGFMPSSDVVA